MEVIQEQSLKHKLQKIQGEKNKIEKEIKNIPLSPSGTACFALYKMKKRYTELQEEILKINKYLYPNIIA